VRKAPAAGAKKGSVLGAKKTPKLGAKKAEVIDFDAEEKNAKEEAERIAKLGYDPEAEKAEAEAKAKTTASSKIASPTPISPRSSFGANKGHERSASELERLGMGMGRLGFGQVGKPKAPPPKKLGFGATAPSRSSADGTYLRDFVDDRSLC
jgi:ADP-ribosylation factor GTPase-activating protein 2/3